MCFPRAIAKHQVSFLSSPCALLWKGVFSATPPLLNLNPPFDPLDMRRPPHENRERLERNKANMAA